MLSSPATIGGMRDGRANVGADFDSWFPSPRLKAATSIFYREPRPGERLDVFHLTLLQTGRYS